MEIREETLPVLRPLGGEEEIAALREVIESGWWGKGPQVEQLEREFAAMVGARHALAVTSNTHGLDLVLKALEIRNCDVVNPTISFMTTAMVPLWNDCTSNIVDVDRRTLCIDPGDVRRNLRPDTRAIIAVNMAGVPAPIADLRECFDGVIIEDCAHSCYRPGAGRAGDVAIWSFQAVKTMPCGDGGMITTDDTALYEKLLPLTWLGISSTYSRVRDRMGGRPGYSWDYEVEQVGYKAYMTDLSAALCRVQMHKLPAHLARRRAIQQRYNDELEGLIQVPPHSETVQYYGARVAAEDRDALIDWLADKRIHTSVHFKPLHRFQVTRRHRPYPVADTEWRRLISLPVHPGMTDADVDYVVYWVREFFAQRDYVVVPPAQEQREPDGERSGQPVHSR